MTGNLFVTGSIGFSSTLAGIGQTLRRVPEPLMKKLFPAEAAVQS
ncbi:MAG: hypothetical protein RQ754_04075 [Desulfuromonadales bacterium]|nr:hypothetical protein [Desulfuromonadales bacterium]